MLSARREPEKARRRKNKKDSDDDEEKKGRREKRRGKGGKERAWVEGLVGTAFCISLTQHNFRLAAPPTCPCNAHQQRCAYLQCQQMNA
jgi:hypothetical protein